MKICEKYRKCKKDNASRLIYSLGIPNIGISNAKRICRALGEDPKRVIRATEEELVEIQGIGRDHGKVHLSNILKIRRM